MQVILDNDAAGDALFDDAEDFAQVLQRLAFLLFDPHSEREAWLEEVLVNVGKEAGLLLITMAARVAEHSALFVERDDLNAEQTAVLNGIVYARTETSEAA